METVKRLIIIGHDFDTGRPLIINWDQVDFVQTLEDGKAEIHTVSNNFLSLQESTVDIIRAIKEMVHDDDSTYGIGPAGSMGEG